MVKRDYTDYQKDVISNYYKNLDTIMLQKLAVLVSELYLADAEVEADPSSAVLQRKADRLWQKAHKAMVKLNIPESIINHIMGKKDVKILAGNLQEWLSKSK